MAQKTPEQIAEKYGRRVAGAGQDYASGVQSPSRDWASATAAAEPRWKASLQEAMSSGAFARGVSAAGSAKWQERAATVGAQRYVAAAPEAAARYAAVAGKVMQAAGAARDAANRLPNTTQEQRLQRAMAAMKATSSYWKGNR